jgi:uncharacterized damage-inducible protein DinB
MVGKEMILNQFGFNHYRNLKILDTAQKLTPEQWATPLDEGQRSLHQTLFHYLIVQEEWLYLCENGVSKYDFRLIEDYPDAASLLEYTEQTHQATMKYLENLDDEQLATILHPRMPGSDSTIYPMPVWYVLSHILFHSAQHRSEAALMLTRLGYSPSFMDFLRWDR